MNFAEALLNSPALPEKTALITQQGDVTYGDLKRQAQTIARGLQDRGMVQGDRVLLASDSSTLWCCDMWVPPLKWFS